MRDVDAVALDEDADRAVAHVFVRTAAQELVDEPLAQRACRRVHDVDAERLEPRLEDRDPAREHRGAIRLEAAQREFRQVFPLDQGLLQLLQALQGDAVLTPAVLADDFVDRERRAGGAGGALPTGAAVLLAQGTRTSRPAAISCAAESAAVDRAARKELVRVIDAAHVQAVEHHGLEALADHDLGAAAPDVDHEPAADVVGRPCARRRGRPGALPRGRR